MKSIRRHLLVALLAAIAMVTLAATIVVYRTVRQEIDAVSDYHLRQVALALRDRLPGGGPVAGPGVEDFDFLVQIWDRDGTRLYLSRPDSGLPEVAQLGYATVGTTNGEWRVYSADLAGIVVQVAQPVWSRQEHALTAALRSLAPVLLMLPLLALLTWRIVGRALTPLIRLAGEVSARTPSALTPLPEADAPEEAVPLVRALNDLLERLTSAWAAQRAFVADAAHELRTPLAALEMQRQLVERATDPVERSGALADLRAGLTRMTHVVQQLLALARAEPGSGAAAQARDAVGLTDLVAQAVADHAVLAEAKGIDLGAGEATGNPVVQGDPTTLRTLLDNLVDNAIRYSPQGSRVDVDAGVLAGRSYLAVTDHGPGIPVTERERVFDRFYRHQGRSTTGTGLGLAIVKAIAERHEATVTLGDTPGGGLTVRVEFPAHASADGPDACGSLPPTRVPDRDGSP